MTAGVGLRPPVVLWVLSVLAVLAGATVVLGRAAPSSERAATESPSLFEDGATSGAGVGRDDAVGTPTTTGSGPDGASATTTTAPAGPPAPLTASDVGVTPTEIRLGGVLLDCSTCASFGASVTRRLPQLVEAYVADINRRGGINGRRVVLTAKTFDSVGDALSGADSERAACVDVTERVKAFAVISIGAARPQCMYDEHATTVLAPYATGEDDPGTFNRVNGRLWFVHPTARRTLTNWAFQLGESRMLSGRTFGIVTSAAQGLDVQVREVLVPALASRGLRPARVSVLPADFASQPSSAAVEGAAMRSAGVDTVLLAGDIGAMLSFIQDAQRNDWRPQWHQSDFGFAANEVGSQIMPAAYVGAIATSTEGPVGAPVSPSAAYGRCHQIWEQVFGKPTEAADELYLTFACDLVAMFEAGARNAGPVLTRDSFARGLAAIGRFEVASLVGGYGVLGGAYSFGPVKWSVASATVMKRWDGHQYQVISGPTPMGG